MNDHEYELLVSELIAGLAKSTQLRSHDIGSGKKNLVAGASGFRHQIDVSLQDHHSLFLWEVKYWTRKVGAEAILILASRLEDIRKHRPNTAVHASIVSTKHATKGAWLLAAHFEIKINVVYNLYRYALQFANENLIGGAGTYSARATIQYIQDGKVIETRYSG